MQIVESGVSADQVGQFFFVTITAPGAESLPWDESVCRHRPDVPCSGKLGCQVEWLPAAEWNGGAPKRWSWFMTYMRRKLRMDVQYVGTWEWQERGVLHRHVLIRTERPTTEKRVRAAVRNSARPFGFGSQYDVRPINSAAAAEVAYIAKYASKTVDAVEGRKVLDLRTGEIKCSRGFRAWSASRQWGDTMASVKRRQASWARRPVVAVATPAGDGAAGALDDNSESSTVDGVLGVGALVFDHSAVIL